MRRADKKAWVPLFIVLAFSAAAIAPMPAAAQSIFKKFEKQIERAKEQIQQAAHGQTPQQQVSQPQAPQAQRQSTTAAGRPTDPNASIPYSSCCTAAAMQKYARRASFLDIVGIKLGMTPQQAFAAVHAFDPGLKLVIIKSKMQVPGIPESQYPRILRGALVYKAAPRKPVPNFLLPDGTPAYSYSPQGGSDIIQIDFTTPPNPPLVARITRTVMFPQGHPVFASALLAALHKKYGLENVPDPSGSSKEWLYGPGGQLLQRRLTDQERIYCTGGPAGGSASFSLPTSLDGRVLVMDVMWDKYAKLRSYSPGNANGYQASAVWNVSDAIPACIPFTNAAAALNASSPNAQDTDVTVRVESPALWYASWRATQEWMEAKAEAAQRKEQQAVQKNAAPAF